MHDNALTKRLFVEHAPEPADVVIVVGSDDDEESTRRAHHGAALVARGLAPLLLLSGGGHPRRDTSEAETMRATVLGDGVPGAAILLECRSTNTFENLKLSHDLLAREGLLAEVRTVILVSSPWHMRRVIACARSAFGDGVRLLACPSASSCTRHSWTLSAEQRLIVESEALLLETWEEIGILPSTDTP